jgi:hypothetical protein
MWKFRAGPGLAGVVRSVEYSRTLPRSLLAKPDPATDFPHKKAFCLGWLWRAVALVRGSAPEPPMAVVQSADVLFASKSRIIDALCGNFNARVRAPQGCERAGLDWSALSSASARQASKITFASAKGRPSISRECSGKTDQASPQGAADKDRRSSMWQI